MRATTTAIGQIDVCGPRHDHLVQFYETTEFLARVVTDFEVLTAHGGSVDVSSSDALGTTFAVSLPRS